ncbi:MAG TPA: hypothetical protein VGG34_15095 [Opitutaceae bacterium]
MPGDSAPRSLGDMRAWLGDLGRLCWGLFYWNARKTLFRARGASGRAPCQHPSDSGRAGETVCEACIGWRGTARFRRLCPLLVADGRRVCSVDARDVRPFWGRAAFYFLGSASLAAILAVLGAFGAFRAVGYRVSLKAVAWPPAWRQVHEARADYFYRMALEAFRSGDVRRCYLALGQAYALDPGNADASRLLAQFMQIGNPGFSDALFAHLVFGRRGDFEGTAQIWLRSLLSRGDFVSCAGLASRMLGQRTRSAGAWTQALLFAESMTGESRESDAVLRDAGSVPGEARAVLLLARGLRSGTGQERRAAARVFLGGAATKFETYYCLRRLAELGDPSGAVAELDANPGALDPYDSESLRLDAYSMLGWHDVERQRVALILDSAATPVAVELVAAHLVRYPDAGTAAALFALLDARPLPNTPEDSGARVSLLCAAGVNGLRGRMAQEADEVAKVTGGPFPAWDRIQEFFGDTPGTRNPAAILPGLGQLPLDMAYALFRHYRPQPQPAA